MRVYIYLEASVLPSFNVGIYTVYLQNLNECFGIGCRPLYIRVTRAGCHPGAWKTRDGFSLP
jgi:hypothetical protein